MKLRCWDPNLRGLNEPTSRGGSPTHRGASRRSVIEIDEREGLWEGEVTDSRGGDEGAHPGRGGFLGFEVEWIWGDSVLEQKNKLKHTTPKTTPKTTHQQFVNEWISRSVQAGSSNPKSIGAPEMGSP